MKTATRKEPPQGSVSIAVYDHQRKVIKNASVKLAPTETNRLAKSVRLKFDERLRVYQQSNVVAGNYSVSVEARGFQSDAREIHVGSAELRETFILGTKGMRFYYRDKVKVPFDPPRDLLAVGLAPDFSEKSESELYALAQTLKLRTEPVSEAITNDNVRVFRFESGTDEKTKASALDRLSSHRLVRSAGPVIHLYPQSVTFLTNELVVKFKAHVTKDEIPKLAKRFNLEILRSIPYAGNAFQLRAKGSARFELLDACDEIVKTGLVEYAEPELVTNVILDFTPDDFLFAQQTHHPILDSEGAWDFSRGTESVIVAVVDNGCDTTHPDFQNPPMTGWTKIYSPFNFTNLTNNPNVSPDGHGTKSTGLAAAVHDNAVGVAGLGSGCQVMPIRYVSPATDTNRADMYVWIAGFDPNSATPGFPAPISPGADVISSSFGVYQMALSGVMKDALDFITTYGRNGRGCVVVFSVGNDNCDFTNCPAEGGARQWAAYEKTIAVASSRISPPDPAETKVSTSNFGPLVDVCAPGGGTGGAQSRTMSTTNVGTGTTAGEMGGSLDYASFGQTSAAAPQVSGVAALMLSAAPNLTWVEVRQILRDTAVKIDMANVDPIGQYVAGYSQWYGFGRIDAHAAVETAATYPFNRDIVVRENLVDGGGVPSAPGWWNSPDIWVRTTNPAVDPGPTQPATYDDAPTPPIHEDAEFEQDNWVYVRLKNREAADSFDFYVRVYLTHFAGSEFVYPDDFEPTVRPSDPVPNPLVLGTYLLGEFHHGPLAAGAVDVINVLWPSNLVPPETVDVMGSPVHWHPCLLVEVSPHDGPAATGNHVWDDNNLAQKNISISYTDDDDEFATAAVIGNKKNKSEYLELEFNRGAVPPEIPIFVEFGDSKVLDRLREFKDKGHITIGGGSCKLIFLEDTRVILTCKGDKGQRILTMPAKSHLDLAGTTLNCDVSRYNFEIGYFHGRQVVWLAKDQLTRVPVFARADNLMPLIVGGKIEPGVKPGFYELGVTQYDADGKGSGAFSVVLPAGQKRPSSRARKRR